MHSFDALLDVINYLISIVLGYRLGTLISLVSALACVLLALKIAEILLPSRKVAFLYLLLFLLLTVNESVFQIGTYYTDNTYAAGVLLLVYLALRFSTNPPQRLILGFAVVGISLGVSSTKLTNAIYLIPIVAVFLFLIFKMSHVHNLRKLLFLGVASATFFIIAGPNLWKTGVDTGNPVFPYFNSFFKSDYWAPSSWQFNFGPRNFLERLFYPLVSTIDPKRLGEVKDLFPDVKLNILFFIALVLLLFAIRTVKLELHVKVLIFVTFASYAFWAFVFGYTRYAIALEMMLVLVVVYLFGILSVQLKIGNILSSIWVKIASLLMVGATTALIVGFNLTYDISWRPNAGPDGFDSILKSGEFWQRYTVISSDIEKRLESADIVIQCVNPSSGFIPTLQALVDKPMINMDLGSNGEMTTNAAYISEIRQRLNRFSKGSLEFVAVVGKTPNNPESLAICLDTFDEQRKYKHRIVFDDILRTNQFMGDERTELNFILGRLDY
jgi:hypothetical protein